MLDVDMPMLVASRARTSLAIVGAAGTLMGALLLGPAPAPHLQATSYGDDGVRVEARFATTRLLSGATERDVAVTITIPSGPVGPTPRSVVVVIDRSGSMSGTPLAEARRAAHALVDQLSASDAFAIVTYSSADETVAPIALATPAAKQRAHAAIDQIVDDGGTCISCGLERGIRELAASPVTTGLRRVVLISDGQANQGISDRDELAAATAAWAATGIAITSIGVGLDFDEATMVRLANVGHGTYHFAEDTAELAGLFQRELAELDRTIGGSAMLSLEVAPGAQVIEAYGHAVERDGARVRVPLADLRAGEQRTIVLRTSLPTLALGDASPATVEVSWRRPDTGALRHAGTTPVVVVVADRDEVAATVDLEALALIETARTGQALAEAAAVDASHGPEAARQVLDRRDGELEAVPSELRSALRRVDADARELLRLGPAIRARKELARIAFQLTH